MPQSYGRLFDLRAEDRLVFVLPDGRHVELVCMDTDRRHARFVIDADLDIPVDRAEVRARKLANQTTRLMTGATPDGTENTEGHE